ncbi:MAG: aminoacyl-tRNA deacylase [Oscillospiraceae bacterium]|jgi:Cys-tRNA(Pro)/Cys-tRNA(Cys) deacylase|nr:aminoacyl-tRNA deacylase [Oscillospiraceae bacterium]
MADYDKTNAMRIMENAGFTANPRPFPTAFIVDSGIGAADALGMPYHLVFKTLVTVGRSGGRYVFVIPVDKDLNMRYAAELTGEKSMAMLPMNLLVTATGYVHGGCSPLGMKKKYPTYIDATALQLSKILVSAGRRGLMMEVSPEALGVAAAAKFEFLTTEFRQGALDA